MSDFLGKVNKLMESTAKPAFGKNKKSGCYMCNANAKKQEKAKNKKPGKGEKRCKDCGCVYKIMVNEEWEPAPDDETGGMFGPHGDEIIDHSDHGFSGDFEDDAHGDIFQFIDSEDEDEDYEVVARKLKKMYSKEELKSARKEAMMKGYEGFLEIIDIALSLTEMRRPDWKEATKRYREQGSSTMYTGMNLDRNIERLLTLVFQGLSIEKFLNRFTDDEIDELIDSLKEKIRNEEHPINKTRLKSAYEEASEVLAKREHESRMKLLKFLGEAKTALAAPGSDEPSREELVKAFETLNAAIDEGGRPKEEIQVLHDMLDTVKRKLMKSSGGNYMKNKKKRKPKK